LTREAAYWDGVAELWLRERPQVLWRRHSDAVNRALLERWLPAAPRRVLKTDLFDEAVGEGLYAFLAARAESVCGVDLARPIVAAAARHPGLEAAVADVRHLPFADGEFDAVVSNSTLDHFESLADLRAGLAELARVLSPGGTLVVTLDNPANPFVAARGAVPRRLLERLWGRHGALAVRLAPSPLGATCGTRRLRSLLAEAGFEVAETGAVVHCPRALAIAAADLLERHAGRGAQDAFLRALRALEGLERLPTRAITGHFVAARAIRRPS